MEFAFAFTDLSIGITPRADSLVDISALSFRIFAFGHSILESEFVSFESFTFLFVELAFLILFLFDLETLFSSHLVSVLFI